MNRVVQVSGFSYTELFLIEGVEYPRLGRAAGVSARRLSRLRASRHATVILQHGTPALSKSESSGGAYRVRDIAKDE